MSSRSLAAARSRRAGENAPPVSGNRPGTSIGSHAAFANQQQYQQPSSNVRVSKQQSATPGQQYKQQYQQDQVQPQPQQNKLGFNKISISDAIGLVTLRLGRVEQYVIETEHEKEVNGNQGTSSNSIDTTLVNNIINRLDSLEKKDFIPEDITKLTEQLTRISDESNKHTLAISKHNEQLFRFERELTETKDILKTFMIKYDTFAKETSDRFSDFEFALAEVEKNIPVNDENNDSSENNDTSENNDRSENNDTSENNDYNIDSNTLISDELKNMIKQEFSVSS